MEAHSNEITDLVVQQQYEKGVSGSGVALAPYSNPYAKRKQKAGKLQGHTDYSWSGAMHENMSLIINEETYAIVSKVEVNGYSLSAILGKRDPDSFELTDENKKVAADIIAPELADRLNTLIT